MGAARLHDQHPGRSPRRPRRAQRCGQEHLAQPGGRVDGTDHRPGNVLGGVAAGSIAALDGIAFVAQDMPLYRHLSVADMLHLTAT